MGKKSVEYSCMEKHIQDILCLALSAPSAHNSQPWEVCVEGNRISIGLAKKRLLSNSDANKRQAFTSVGCFISALEIAAASRGYVALSEYADSPNEIFCARVVISETPDHMNVADQKSLGDILSSRLTNRFAYTAEPIAQEFKQAIFRRATDDVFVQIEENVTHRDSIAGLAQSAEIEAMSDSGFRKELSRHIRHGFSHVRIGIPTATIGIPKLVSVLVPIAIRLFNMSKASKKSDFMLLTKGTPAYIVLSAPDTPVGWMNTGKVYFGIALEAEARGYVVAPWQSVIQIGSAYRRLQDIVGSPQRPQFLMRVGRPTRMTSVTPRLRLIDVLHI